MSTIQRIIKSTSDLRNYKSITLKNKLQCLIVSDLKADKSAAAMNVNVGHLLDPVDRPGLAHFLEHMLFMGTEKYPNQSEYSEYLSKNGGFSNAYTSQMETNYYFACQNASIEGALDRFSQFFINPLFSEGCVEKEMKAVDSEHQKNIMQDSWRLLQLFRGSAHPHSEFCKFGTGDLTTLNHPTIRDDLIKFYKQYYSANLMRLVVYSNQDIPVIENWVQSLFSEIPNSDYSPPSFTTLPFTKENLGSIWKIVPVKDIHQLSIKWVLPDMRRHYKNNPSSYLSHLLGHEGENSLLSILIKNGLAVELSAGSQNEQNLWSIMNVVISLTNKGVENYELVLEYVFSYLQMLKEKGVQRWVFDEIKLLSELNFSNKDNEKPDGYAHSLASRMQYYPIEEVLIQPYLNEKYDEQLIQETVNAFNIDNIRISVISKKFAEECNLVEPIYKTNYSVNQIDERLRNIFENPRVNVEHNMIKPNTFLPKNMELFTKEFDNLPEYPYLIRNEKHSDVWFKSDNIFKKPKAILKVRINFNEVSSFSKSKVLLAMWNTLLKEEMREISYMAEIAYLGQSVTPIDSSLNLYVGGYNDSLPQYTKQLFEIIANFKCTEKHKFDIQYEKMMRQYQNISKMQPYQTIFNYLLPMITTNGMNPDDLVPTLSNLTFEEYLQFQENFMKKLSFQWLVQGNMTEEIVKEFTIEAENILLTLKNATTLPVEEITAIRATQIPNKSLFWEKVLEEHETNSAILTTYQYKQETLKEELKLEFLQNIISTPFFDKLRTDEQLGYVVHSMLNATRNVLGFVFMIQSNVKHPQYLSQRIDIFLNEFQQKVDSLTQVQFEEYRTSIISNLSQKPKSIFEEANNNWDEVTNNQRQFNRKQLLLKEIHNIQLIEVQNLFRELFFEQKKKLEVHFVCKNHLEENQKLKEERLATQEIEEVKSIIGFRNSNSLFPDFFSRL